MDTDLNHVTLTGILERDPITKFADHGPNLAKGQILANVHTALPTGAAARGGHESARR